MMRPVEEELDGERARRRTGPGAIECEVCGRLAIETERGWQGLIGINDHDENEVIIYCPACLDELLIDD
jgi:hypothetical protein